MKFTDEIKDKWQAVTVQLMGLFFLCVFLRGVGIGRSELLIIITGWFITLVLFFVLSYGRRKRQFEETERICEELDQKYLLSEVMEKPKSLEGCFYYELLSKTNKSMVEQVSMAEEERTEYKEYIEQWIHEIKVPIASARLICENNKDATGRRILTELMQIDHEVEKALYFARSGSVEQDYIVSETDLEEMVREVIVSSKQMFLQNQMQIELADLRYMVYTDSKWIGFILNQIFINCMKYKSGMPRITIYAEAVKNGVRLIIEDNGIGIKNSELPRIFDKGFTGTNGRQEQKATGIGLYLCKKLCDKLGILIQAESDGAHYTKVILVFPKGSYLAKM